MALSKSADQRAGTLQASQERANTPTARALKTAAQYGNGSSEEALGWLLLSQHSVHRGFGSPLRNLVQTAQALTHNGAAVGVAAVGAAFLAESLILGWRLVRYSRTTGPIVPRGSVLSRK